MDREAILNRMQVLTAGLNEIAASLNVSSNSGRGNSNANSTNNNLGHPSSTLSVESELRHRFSPYSTPPRAGTSNGLFQTIRSCQNLNPVPPKSSFSSYPHRGRRNSGVFPKKEPVFSRRVVFLGDKCESRIPTSARIRELQEKGVNEDVVYATRNNTGEELYHAINSLFTDTIGRKFPGQNLTWKIGYARGKGVVDITFFENCPPPSKIITLKISCLYARPDQDLVPIVIDPIEMDQIDFEECAYDSVNGELSPSTDRSFCSSFEKDRPEFPIAKYDGLRYSEFKDLVRQEYPGTQYIVVTQISEVDITLELELPKFKDELSTEKFPRIRMMEVESVDLGGPLKAYIWIVLKKALISNLFNGVPIFEGEMNHLLPSRDACLLNDGVYFCLGRLIAFCILNAGVGFFGLSTFIPQFLLCNEDDKTYLDCITEDDIPYPDFRVGINKLMSCVGNNATRQLDNIRCEVRDILLESGWTYPLRNENVISAVLHLKLYSVVHIRKDQLLDMRRGFAETEVSKWLKYNRNLLPEYFKEASSIKATITDVVSAFGIIDASIVCSFNHLCNYLQRISKDQEKVEVFIQALTGSSILGNERLHIEEDETISEFHIETCGNNLRVIPYLTQEQFFQKMETVIANSAHGFSKL